MIREKFEKEGLTAFAIASSFDQAAVLQENAEYISFVLKLDKLEIRHTDESNTPIEVSEAVCPSEPLIIFSKTGSP